MRRPTLSVAELEQKARSIRRMVLEKIASSGKGHIGGTYSCTDLLVALYCGGVLRIDPANPLWPDRDRLIVGKGHACLALYAVFLDLGMMSRARFDEYGRDGGALGGQLDRLTPGVENNTGSLGHALGIAAGIALAAKLDGRSYRAYALLGDAECSEGSIWETVMFANQYKLNNLIGIIDRNRLSVTDVLDDEVTFGNYRAKLESFGWDCHEIDGHSFDEIRQAFDTATAATRPVMIVANTVKGKGVSFMENGVKWHHAVPSGADLERALQELAG